jgi:hypothetical protein
MLQCYFFQGITRVVIRYNLCVSQDSETAETNMPRVTDSSFEDDSDEGEQVAEQVAVGDSEASRTTEKFPTKFGEFWGQSPRSWITCLL